MKVAIVAGGKGTRISEESRIKPKPMVAIGGKPILWHIMKLYSKYGFNEFVICCGYKGQMIKEYFIHYYMYQSDSTFILKSGSTEYHDSKAEPWKVTLANTGLNTQTAGRVLRVRDYIGDEPFLLTYGDGVSDVDISKLVDSHAKSGKLVTLTAVQPEGRFGALDIKSDGTIAQFQEKPSDAWINGGFFVCENKALDYIEPATADKMMWERV